MADVMDLGGPGVRLRVEGLRETIRGLEQAGADAADMRDLMGAIGATVAQAAVPLTRTGTTGKLRGSIRPGRGKTKAIIRMGGARVPYAGVQHYGGYHNITADLSLVRAVQTTRAQVISQLDDGLRDILRKNDLI